MLTSFFETDSPAAARKPAGNVILFGLEEAHREVWAQVAADGSVACHGVDSMDACVAYAATSTPAVIVATEATFEPCLASRIDPRFRRSTTLVSVEDDSQVGLWRWVAWNAVADHSEPAALAVALIDAMTEVAKRTCDWNLYDDFKQRRSTLSVDEDLVFKAVCLGRLNKQIAASLNVSLRTIEQRRRRLFNKMGVESAVPLAAMTARVQALEEFIAREQERETRLEAISLAPPAVDQSATADLKPSVPKPKFSGGFLSSDSHSSSGAV